MKVRVSLASLAIVLACLPYQDSGVYLCDPKSGRDCDAGVSVDASNPDAQTGSDAETGRDAAAGTDAASGPDAGLDAEVGDGGHIELRDAGGPDAGVCRSGTWCREQAAFSGSMNGVWAIAPDDVWVVGSGGTAWHWDGEGWWKSSDTGTQGYDLNAVWASATDDVWAVGANGWISHWNGTQWVASKAPEPGGWGHSLNAVWGRQRAGVTEVWIAGDNGFVYRGGTSGFVLEKPTSDDESHHYYGVRGTADKTIVVGWWGEVQTRNADGWSETRTDLGHYLQGVWAGEAHGTWIASTTGQVLKSADAGWDVEVPSNISEPTAIWSDGQRIWLAGKGLVSKSLDGSDSWASETFPDDYDSTYRLAAIHGAGGVVWAVTYGAVYRRAP